MKFFTKFLLLFVLLYANSLGSQGKNRIERVKAILLEKGVSPQRLQVIFSSEFALKEEHKAINIITNIKNIKKHRKAESAANDKMLLKTALLKKHIKKYRKVYDKAEKDFGVNREIIAAILQKETALGAYKNYKHHALSVYVSMLKGLDPQAETGRAKVRLERFVKFAHDNLVMLISFFELQGLDVLKEDLRSSYAGAVGIPQFSPMHFDMILSPDKKAHFDLHDMPTAIYSTANLLKNRFGWKRKIQFRRLKHLDTVIKKWKKFNTGTQNFVYETNLEGISVPTFINSFQYDKEVHYVADYIKVLKRYNFSTNYALGILLIAKASRG